MAKFTDKQEAFCQASASGRNDSDAYREAYPASLKWKSATVHREAHKLRRNPKIAARIDELKAEIAKKNLWTREKSVIALVGVVEDHDKKSDIIAAVKELNLMHGFNEPERGGAGGLGDLSIVFNVSDPKSQVVVTRGSKDK